MLDLHHDMGERRGLNANPKTVNHARPKIELMPRNRLHRRESRDICYQEISCCHQWMLQVLPLPLTRTVQPKLPETRYRLLLYRVFMFEHRMNGMQKATRQPASTADTGKSKLLDTKLLKAMFRSPRTSILYSRWQTSS